MTFADVKCTSLLTSLKYNGGISSIHFLLAVIKTISYFILQVYSVIDNTIHVKLYKRLENGSVTKESMNDYLIRKGYGEKAEESYLSKVFYKIQIQNVSPS